jgi:hypothetical protein
MRFLLYVHARGSQLQNALCLWTWMIFLSPLKKGFALKVRLFLRFLAYRSAEGIAMAAWHLRRQASKRDAVETKLQARQNKSQKLCLVPFPIDFTPFFSGQNSCIAGDKLLWQYVFSLTKNALYRYVPLSLAPGFGVVYLLRVDWTYLARLSSPGWPFSSSRSL